MGRPNYSRRAKRRARQSHCCLDLTHTRPLHFEHLESRRLLAAGDLDPTFGVGGKVTTEFFHDNISTQETIYSVATTASGKIIAAGEGAFVVQYNSDGSLDSTFGQKGFAAFGGRIRDLEVQSDGKILAVGQTEYSDFLIYRYDVDGNPDSTFGDSGIVVTDMGGADTAFAVAVQNDGRIIAVGSSRGSGTSVEDFAVARYMTSGALDTTFSSDGKLTTDFGAGNDQCNCVVVQSNGRIVAAGRSGTGFAVARYNVNGSLDTSLDGDGKLITNALKASDELYRAAVQTDGKILLAGNVANGNNSDFAIARFNANGTPDNSFGGTGKVTTELGADYDSATDIVLQDDGKILVAGTGTGSTSITAVRYTATGQLDTSFSSDGIASLSYDYRFSRGLCATLQDDGSIVVAGSYFDGSSHDLAIAKFRSDGNVDSLFDMDGVVTTNIGASIDQGYAMAIQPNGKIVVVGSSRNGYYSNYDEFAIARYDVGGNLDTSFGISGRAILSSYNPSNGKAQSVAIQDDGRIVVGGYLADSFGVARFNADGLQDVTFNGRGWAVTGFGTTSILCKSIALQNDGKIVAAGATSTFSYLGDSWDFALARFNADGSLDTSFDSDGRVITDFGTRSDVGFAIAVQEDGKIIVVGDSASRFAVARYNVDGSLDTTFDGDGRVITDDEYSGEQARSLAIQADGKIIVAGYSGNGSNDDFTLVRYNTNGSLDTTFDGDGRLTTDFDGKRDQVYSVVVQENGKIVAAGSSFNGQNDDFALARYNSDGTLDTSFGVGGKATTRFGPTYDQAYGVALQSDGRIVVAGSVGTYGQGPISNFALARYEGDSQTPSVLLGDYSLNGAVDAADYVVWRNSVGNSISPFGGADGDGNGTIGQSDYSVWRTNFGRQSAPALPGDYNLSGTVDAADFVLWRKTVGTAVPAYSGADGDGDGVVDQDDYSVWRANFGQMASTSASSATAGISIANTAVVAESAANSTATLEAVDGALMDDASMFATTTLVASAASRPVPRTIVTDDDPQEQALLAWLETASKDTQRDDC